MCKLSIYFYILSSILEILNFSATDLLDACGVWYFPTLFNSLYMENSEFYISLLFLNILETLPQI